MTALSSLFTQDASVETYQGATRTGPSYAAAVTVKGFLDDGVTVQTLAGARQIVAVTKFYTTIDQAAVFTIDSKVTVNGRVNMVTAVHRREGSPLLRAVEHLEVDLG